MTELQQYEFKIIHRPGKLNANADALSRMYDENEVEVNLTITQLYNEQENEPAIEWIRNTGPPTLNIRVDELTEWYYQHEVCNQCGKPDTRVEKYGIAWNAPCLCKICKTYNEQMEDAEFIPSID